MPTAGLAGPRQHLWPAVYIADGQGRIRYHQFGEGEYAMTQIVVHPFLSPRAMTTASRTPVLGTAPLPPRLRVSKTGAWVLSFGGRPHGRSRRLGEPGELGSRWRMANVCEAHDDRRLAGIVAPRARAAVHLD
jgi:hypothetical protein